MIGNLNDINRVLISVRQLTSSRIRVPRTQLIRHLRADVMLGQNPEFGAVIEFVEWLGLTRTTTTGIGLSELGNELLSANAQQFYELAADQRKLLLRKCYLDGALRKHMRRFAKALSFSSRGELRWSPIDSEPLDDIEWLLGHLLQLGVVTQRKNFYIVARGYTETVLHFLDEGSDFTEEQFEKSLREKRLLGAIAESFVLAFEKERLRNSGHSLESVCVKHVSKLRVNAGFDICSFDGQARALTHDRYIEVKGSGQTGVRFVWTQNEMKKAADLKDKYWIYFVGGIDRKQRLVTREPVMIQDPLNILNNDARFSLNAPDSLVVLGNFSAPPLTRPVRVAR